ncbi:BLUF domain-containing protein [Novosphingobium sp.]|uniref:BLUF domain-containing protein n=1 Tax=Novosphingobium sp. TaxID=1874826 RepID=UPI00333FA9A0
MQAHAESNGAMQSEWLASLTYRSEAAVAPSPADLQSMVTSARGRNRTMGVTGMLLYDDGRYLQTIEGPPEAVELVWSSIQRDPRHGRIEILSQHIVPSRLFSGWDMQLVDERAGQHRQARAAGMLADAGPVNATVRAPLIEHIPATARFAMNGDDRQLNALIGDLVAQGWVGNALVRNLLEPTARVLGDAWLAEECSEVDLTIALSMLQLAGHAVHSRTCAESIRKSRYSILLVTAPGERHLLGPSLLGDLFNNAGWSVDIAFPETNEQLADQLRSQRPDAVDIALSDAVPRHHALMRLAETVEKCRAASPDELLVVSVGGRLFAEAAATAPSVSADHARLSAVGTSIRLAGLIEQRRSRT